MAYYIRDFYVVGKFDGVTKVAATINADTADDLPDYNDCNGVDGELTLGTIAFVADEVEFYGLTSDGTWHKHGEEDESSGTKSVSNLRSSSPLILSDSPNLAKTALEPMPEEYYTEDAVELEPAEEVEQE